METLIYVLGCGVAVVGAIVLILLGVLFSTNLFTMCQASIEKLALKRTFHAFMAYVKAIIEYDKTREKDTFIPFSWVVNRCDEWQLDYIQREIDKRREKIKKEKYGKTD